MYKRQVLGEHDYTEPSLNTSLNEGDAITVHRVEYRDTVVQTAIEPETVYQETSLLYRRKSATYAVSYTHLDVYKRQVIR